MSELAALKHKENGHQLTIKTIEELRDDTRTKKCPLLKWEVESGPLKAELHGLKGETENCKGILSLNPTAYLCQLPLGGLHLNAKSNHNSSALSAGKRRYLSSSP